MKILDKEILLESKFTKYCVRHFIDKHGNKKQWEFMERTQSSQAVVVVAKNYTHEILVKQFRMPLNKYVIEFPAGIIDTGETVSEAAIRELKEETGLSGKVTSVSPALSASPGLASEIIYFAEMEVGKDAVIENQDLDDTEEIELFLLDKDKVKEELLKIVKNDENIILDTKVWVHYFT